MSCTDVVGGGDADYSPRVEWCSHLYCRSVSVDGGDRVTIACTYNTCVIGLEFLSPRLDGIDTPARDNAAWNKDY